MGAALMISEFAQRHIARGAGSGRPVFIIARSHQFTAGRVRFSSFWENVTVEVLPDEPCHGHERWLRFRQCHPHLTVNRRVDLGVSSTAYASRW
jgi:hypothetical protein